MLVYRFGSWLKQQRWYAIWVVVPLIVIYWLARIGVEYFYDIRLDLSADIGPGFRIWHFGGVLVSQCKIGANCTIHQCVKICPAEGCNKGPELGSDVWVGPHAEIEGSIKVGSGVAVSAASKVINDVPQNSLVVGRPGRVIKINFNNNALFS